MLEVGSLLWESCTNFVASGDSLHRSLKRESSCREPGGKYKDIDQFHHFLAKYVAVTGNYLLATYLEAKRYATLRFAKFKSQIGNRKSSNISLTFGSTPFHVRAAGGICLQLSTMTSLGGRDGDGDETHTHPHLFFVKRVRTHDKCRPRHHARTHHHAYDLLIFINL